MKIGKNSFSKFVNKLVCVALIACMLASFASIVPAVAEEAPAEDGGAKGNVISILIAKKDIEAGTKITKEMFELKEFKNVNIPATAITSMDKVVGKYSVVDIYKGEFVYEEKFSATKEAENVSGILLQPIAKTQDKFVVVTDFFPANTGKDVAKLIQELIDKNPNRTIYFPDGEYIISKPILTDGRAAKSVSIRLSDGAVIKASDKWTSSEALIRLGGIDPEGGDAHEINSVTTYYSFMGGTLDGNGRANGLSIDAGRETLVKDVCIVNAKTGLTIKKAEVYTSTDADVENVTIVGNGSPGTKGLHVIGFDNTITNVNIYDVEIGAHIAGGGTLMKNINVYYTHSSKLDTLDKKYAQTIGIYETCSGNWFYDFYVQNYATAFKLVGSLSVIDRCFAQWNTDEGGTQTMFEFTNAWYCVIGNCKADFSGSSPTCAFVKAPSRGTGIIEGAMFNESLVDNKYYQNNLRTPVVGIS